MVSEEQSFRDLIRRIQQGEEQAAAEVVRLYEPELRRFVRHRLSTPLIRRFIESQDVTQSVFAVFFVRLADGHLEVEHPRQLSKLLITMATNKIRDHIRKQKAGKRSNPDGQQQSLETIADLCLNPSESVAAREFLDHFRSRLSPGEQHLLDLRLQGDGWPEIAAAVDGSPEAIRKQLTRAIDRVATQLGLNEA